MARTPQGAAARQPAEDDFYEGDETEGREGEGQDEGDRRPQRTQGRQSASDATFDARTQQTSGRQEHLNGESEDAEDDELGGESEDAEDDDFYAEPALSPNRADTRFQRLSNENKAQARRIADLERNERAPVQPAFQSPQQEPDNQFEARISGLPPDERSEQRQIRFQHQMAVQNHTTQFNAAELADRTSFRSTATASARRARWETRVEEEHQRLLGQGQVVSRENIFFWMLGKHVDLNVKGVGKARTAANRRVARQTVQPVQAGSDVRRSGGREQLSEQAQRAKRLDGVRL